MLNDTLDWYSNETQGNEVDKRLEEMNKFLIWDDDFLDDEDN